MGGGIDTLVSVQLLPARPQYIKDATPFTSCYAIFAPLSIFIRLIPDFTVLHALNSNTEAEAQKSPKQEQTGSSVLLLLFWMGTIMSF